MSFTLDNFMVDLLADKTWPGPKSIFFGFKEQNPYLFQATYTRAEN